MDLKAALEAHEKFPHRAHQLDGITQLYLDTDPSRGRVIPKVFALLDQVGAGKSKQVVDTGQLLYRSDKIDTVVSLVPGFARSTWASDDPVLGEVAKHAWDAVPNIIHEFHRTYTDLDLSTPGLHWIVSNYEFIRREERLQCLLDLLKGRRVWLVLDESWCVKGNSKQTKACLKLRRKRADRVTILNGTPLSDGKPMDLFYQFAMLDLDIIGCSNRTHFRSKYCVMGGFAGKQIVDYKNLDELNRRIAPYVLSRRTRDCFDLPPILPPVTVAVPLDDPTWKIYRAMRDDLVAWLGTQASVSRQAIVKALRLAQITSGYLGGLEDVDSDADFTASGKSTTPIAEPMPAWLRQAQGKLNENPPVRQEAPPAIPPTTAGPVERITVCREIGREKLDAFLFWLTTLDQMPDKLLVWCRFRPELERLTEALKTIYPHVYNLKGGQSPEDRELAKRALAPGSTGRAAVVGNQKAGGASLNFAAAPIAVYMSNGPALIERTQSWGRTDRPGATQPMTQVDIVATGPKGQKTIDHHILKSLRSKDDMANWTVDQWRKILAEE